VPLITCLDLEGVLVPEVWIAFAEKTGITELRRTTRDEPDYDKLMRGRLAILDRHGFKLGDIQDVIATLRPLEGALEFMDTLRARTQVIILSDTFYQFAVPLMRQLAWPTLFCHDLVVDPAGRVADYRLRIPDGKRRAVTALKTSPSPCMPPATATTTRACSRPRTAACCFGAPTTSRPSFRSFAGPKSTAISSTRCWADGSGSSTVPNGTPCRTTIPAAHGLTGEVPA
jgi:phosphoserine / homoserine phosphotransferase